MGMGETYPMYTKLTPDHGEDWGLAAVELAAEAAQWGQGNI